MDILQECIEAKSIAITGHTRPDGDCVGSCLSLYQYFKKVRPDVYIKIFLEKPSEIFSEIKGYEEIDSTFAEDTVFDVLFILDCANDRIEKSEKYFAKAEKVINVDHHISNKGCGTVNYIFPTIGSTSELIYDLIDKKELDQDIAKAIYTGIIHDTGVFQYSNTSPKTLEAAAHLISFGFNFPKIIEETFYQRTYVQSQILGRALMESVRFSQERCVVSYIDKKTMDFYGVTTQDFDGIVNQLRNIKGISCAIFMYQIGVLEYKVSLRSDEKVNVAKVASVFGGGGHMRAAGCTMQGTFHDCVNNISKYVEMQLTCDAK